MNNNKNPQPDPTYASYLLDELDYIQQAEADLMADALVQEGQERLEHVQSDLGQTKSKKEQKPKAKRSSSAKREVDQEGDDDLDNESEENDVEDEFADEMESELKTVIEEIAEEELAALLEETGGKRKQTLSTLATKLKVFPKGDFPVSPYSTYDQNVWTLFVNQYGSARRINFEGMPSSMIELRKAITFHQIPEFAPFGGVRSYVTTYWHSSLFTILDRYLMKPNFLDGSPESIRLINLRMVNKALDDAKNTDGSPRHYHSLFYMLRFWSSLSTQGLMPEGLALDLNMLKVDTVERRKDVILQYAGSMGTWMPFSEEDLGQLVNYALFWTEKALPRLLQVVDYVKQKNLDSTKKCAVVRYEADQELEDMLNIELDGVKVVSASKKFYEYRYGKREQYVYNWLRSYAVSVDHVRNAVYVLLALITGLRASELRDLKFSNLIKDGNGIYTLRAVRYKTAADPNAGEVAFLPIPQFIGQKIDELERLRSIYTLKAQDFIFQSTKGRKGLNKPNSHMLALINRELSEATGVDRIHCHRFRKTIAEILINRSERNIDLIRHLFGHKSYAMTLKYIGRNPFLVRSVALAIEQNYTIEFSEIVKTVQHGASSGPVAERLMERIQARPNAFTGKQLKVTVFEYVSHLLSSGEPLFIHRTAMGTFCVSTQTYSSPNLPPCLAHLKGPVSSALPNHRLCDNQCQHIIVVESARSALQDNKTFYTNLLEKSADTLSERAKKMIRQKIAGNTQHLENLERTGVHIVPTKVVA